MTNTRVSPPPSLAEEPEHPLELRVAFAALLLFTALLPVQVWARMPGSGASVAVSPATWRWPLAFRPTASPCSGGLPGCGWTPSTGRCSATSSACSSPRPSRNHRSGRRSARRPSWPAPRPRYWRGGWSIRKGPSAASCALGSWAPPSPSPSAWRPSPSSTSEPPRRWWPASPRTSDRCRPATTPASPRSSPASPTPCATT